MYTFEQKYRRLKRELIAGGIALVCIFLLGTLWYWLVEKWSLLEAIYSVSHIYEVHFSHI